MKRLTPCFLAIAVVAIILALTAQSVIITAGPEVVLEWDQVTTLEGGIPIPADSNIYYEVTLDGDPLGMTVDTSYDITLPSQGRRVFGVRTVLTITNGEEARSEYATLAVIIVYRPSKPENVRVR